MTAPTPSAVHMTTVHQPGDVRIYEKECLSLAAAGWEVTLLATGEAHVPGPVRVITLSKPRSRMQRIGMTTWALMRSAWRIRANVYHIHDPELLPAALLLRLAGRTVVYDVHEDLPRQVLAKPWIPKAVRPAVGLASGAGEALAARVLSAVVAATPQIGRRFPPGKTVVVRNYPRAFIGEPGVPYRERANLVIYAGGVTGIRGGREMAAAAEHVSSLGVRLLLVGPAEPRLAEELASRPNVELLGWTTPRRVQELLRTARVGLCVLHPTPNYIDSLPTKLFEYMAAGLPVVASHFPGWRAIVDEAECGLTVDPLNPEALGDAIRYLIENPDIAQQMGERGRAAAASAFRWEGEFPKLHALYERMLHEGRRP